MNEAYIIDLALLMIACAVVFSCATMMQPLRQRALTLLVISIVGVSGCLWSLL